LQPLNKATVLPQKEQGCGGESLEGPEVGGRAISAVREQFLLWRKRRSAFLSGVNAQFSVGFSKPLVRAGCGSVVQHSSKMQKALGSVQSPIPHVHTTTTTTKKKPKNTKQTKKLGQQNLSPEEQLAAKLRFCIRSSL
jgi:hypothetical protein